MDVWNFYPDTCVSGLWTTQVTNWLPSPPFAQCDPPLEVKDLFLDIQDGKILMALLEVLSGRSLVRKSLKGQEEAPAAKDSAQGVLSVQECGCAHLDVHTSYTENFRGGPSFMGD